MVLISVGSCDFTACELVIEVTESFLDQVQNKDPLWLKFSARGMC